MGFRLEHETSYILQENFRDEQKLHFDGILWGRGKFDNLRILMRSLLPFIEKYQMYIIIPSKVIVCMS